MSENLAGSAGGGPEPQPQDQVALNRNIMLRGAGAFPSGGDNPPKSRKTATSGYEDQRFARKAMKKK
jgi:hypothetical protein